MSLTFDPIIHPPARLQIMAVLATVQDAEFAMLRKTADISDSVLSKHLSALSEAGYVRLRKAAQDGRQRTWASITRAGRAAFRGHVAALQALAGVVEGAAEKVGEPLPVRA
ncbi:transcriptional regulator [Sphingomonas oligophenolica]|uniref:Transcriptional regulator n=1 Tax=Sphingomonas oligophenolica TaxID=301154 RepID=A0ABU9Y1E6_9SPHN